MSKDETETKQSEALSPDASEEAFRDDIVEFEYNEDGEEDLKKTLKKLRADLKKAKKEKEEYLTGWQKERADFANYKKDEDARRKVSAEFAEERLLSEFLSVADSFNMAFANREAWEKVDEGWRRGVEYIYAQLERIFEERGVRAIGEVGESFDPNLHESVETVATDKESDDNKIAAVIQKGYRLSSRILRPARVNVYEYKRD